MSDEKGGTKSFFNPFPKNKLLAVLFSSFFLGFLVDAFLFHESWFLGLGISLVILQILYFVALGCFVKDKKIDLVVLVVGFFCLTSSLYFAFFNNATLSFFNFVRILLGNAFVTLYISGIIDKIWYFFSSLGRYFGHFFRSIGKGYLSLKLSLDALSYSPSFKKNFFIIFLALIILGILLLIIIPLLTHADQVFSKILRDFFDQGFFKNFSGGSILERIILTFVLGTLFLSSFFLLNTPKKEQKIPEIKKNGISGLLMNIVLVGINIVYLLFVIVQIKFLFFGSHALLVEYGITSYASYAHQGFYQLIVIAFLNTGIFLLFMKSREAHEKKFSFLHVLFLFLLFFTAVMMVSASMRISYYVGSYGLSELRFLVYFAIAIILLSLIFCAIKIFKKNLHYNKMIFFGILACFTILSYLNMDKRIAQFNISHTLSSPDTSFSGNDDLSRDSSPKFRKVSKLDAAYIMTLSSDAIDEKIQLTTQNPSLLNHPRFFYRLDGKDIDLPRYRYNYHVKKYLDYYKKMKIVPPESQ